MLSEKQGNWYVGAKLEPTHQTPPLGSENDVSDYQNLQNDIFNASAQKMSLVGNPLLVPSGATIGNL